MMGDLRYKGTMNDSVAARDFIVRRQKRGDDAFDGPAFRCQVVGEGTVSENRDIGEIVKVSTRAQGEVRLDEDQSAARSYDPARLVDHARAIPRRAVNLLIYHGVLAQHARWRSPVVRFGPPMPTRPQPTPAPGAKHPGCADLARADALRVRPRWPRLAPRWRPTARHRHRAAPGRRADHSHPRRPRALDRAAWPPPRPPAPIG